MRIIDKSLAPKYDETKTYKVDDVVTVGNKMYTCVEGSTEPEAFVSSKWKRFYLTELIQRLTPTVKIGEIVKDWNVDDSTTSHVTTITGLTIGKKYLFINAPSLIFTSVKTISYTGCTADVQTDNRVVASSYTNTSYVAILTATSDTITITQSSASTARTISRNSLYEVREISSNLKNEPTLLSTSVSVAMNSTNQYTATASANGAVEYLYDNSGLSFKKCTVSANNAVVIISYCSTQDGTFTNVLNQAGGGTVDISSYQYIKIRIYTKCSGLPSTGTGGTVTAEDNTVKIEWE